MSSPVKVIFIDVIHILNIARAQARLREAQERHKPPRLCEASSARVYFTTKQKCLLARAFLRGRQWRGCAKRRSGTSRRGFAKQTPPAPIIPHPFPTINFFISRPNANADNLMRAHNKTPIFQKHCTAKDGIWKMRDKARQDGIYKSYFAFLYEIIIWLGANNTDAIINNTDLLIIPLKRNKTDGIIESANALKTLLFLKHAIQIAQ